ncbi:MAG: hypothetical protein WD851_19910, partial [Pirellulales bacterium]
AWSGDHATTAAIRFPSSVRGEGLGEGAGLARMYTIAEGVALFKEDVFGKFGEERAKEVAWTGGRENLRTLLIQRLCVPA